MKLKTLSTGSIGNCYLLESENETLILDCGISFKEIKVGLDFNLSNVVGICVTHVHQDHSKSVSDFEKCGIDVWRPYLEEKKVHKKQFGGFTVQNFDLTDISGNWMHTNADGTECPCHGFLISHKDLGRMLYITDTELIKWRFKNINHILLGVNYDKDLLFDENKSKATHVYKGHLSIDTACDFVKSNDSDSLQNVIMCHLSDSNSDSNSFIEKMQKTVPQANVCVAERRLEVELRNKNECPF